MNMTFDDIDILFEGLCRLIEQENDARREAIEEARKNNGKGSNYS